MEYRNANSSHTYPPIETILAEASPTGAGAVQWSVLSPDSGYDDDSSLMSHNFSLPRLDIVDEPEPTYRFRYARESRKPHGPIKSVSCADRPKNTSHGPQVKLVNFEGEAIIRAWLFQGSLQPGQYLGPSPNCLVKTTGRGQTKLIYEPHDVVVNRHNNYTASFDNYNIIHVVKSETMYQKLYLKKKKNYASEVGTLYVEDPHEVPDDFEKNEVLSDFKTAEKNICCLYYEAYGRTENDKYRLLCKKMSSPIRNIKNAENNLLKIFKQSHVEGPCEGGTEVLIFTEKIVKEVRILFFEGDWQAEAHFKESDIHKRVAISFRTPPYQRINIDEPVTVSFMLVRCHDGETSQPHEFRYMPRDNILPWAPATKRKRPLRKIDPLLCDKVDDNQLFITDDCCEVMGASSLEEGISTGDLFTSPGMLDVFGGELVADYFPPAPRVVYFVEGPSEGNTTRSRGNAAYQDEDNPYAHPTYQLRACVKQGKAAPLPVFLKEGADPYVIDVKYSNTAIHEAILQPSLMCLEVLLKSVQPRAIFNKDGDDPVLFAVRHNKLDALKMLLLKGFSAYQCNVKNGDTPLHLAVEDDQLETVELLLQHGASVYDCNYAGSTPLEYAQTSGNKKMLEKLLKFTDDTEPDVSTLMDMLTLTKEEEEDDDPVPENVAAEEDPVTDSIASLDGDVRTSLEIAKLMGCTFLAPVLKSSQKQSKILLNYLKAGESHTGAVAELSRLLTIAKGNQQKS